MEKEENKKDDYDFDLPDVSQDAPKASKPRVHISDSTCTSCEG